jgi:hypothetical protein
MCPRRVTSPLLVILCTALLAGCGVGMMATVPPVSDGIKPLATSAGIEPLRGFGSELQEGSAADASGVKGGLPLPPTMAYAPAAGQASGSGENGSAPLIIKQAQIRLQVKNTDQAIDRLTQIVSDTGGYIISNRIWYEQVETGSHKYATYTIGVPVEEFETALRRQRPGCFRGIHRLGIAA